MLLLFPLKFAHFPVPEFDKNLLREMHCLANVMYHEARGESFRGIVAVGNVVLNRVKSRKFPDTICEVVHQPYQFSDFRLRNNVPRKFKQIAHDLLLSKVPDNTNGSLYFHNQTAEPFQRKQTVQIGNHTFYR